MFARNRPPIRPREWALFLAPLLLLAVVYGALLGKRVLQHNSGAGNDSSAGSYPYLGISALTFTPDGKQLIIGDSHGEIQVRHTASGSLSQELAPAGSPGVGHTIRQLALSRSGALLATEQGKKVTLWKLASGQVQRVLRAPYFVSGVGFSRSGQLVAASLESGKYVSYHNAIEIWQVNSGQQVALFPANLSGGGMVAFSPDNRTVAVVGSDTAGTGGWVQLWDLKLKKRLWAKATPLCTDTLHFSSDGKTIGIATVSTGRQKWVQFDVRSGQHLQRAILGRAAALEASSAGFTLDPQARTVFYSTTVVCCISIGSTKELADNSSDLIISATSRDGHWEAEGNADGEVKLFDNTQPSNRGNPPLKSWRWKLSLSDGSFM